MLTSAQLVNLAVQTAKVPGYTAMAGQKLNLILQELSQDYDLDVAKGVTSFNFGGTSGPINLPVDWLRAERDDVFYTILGVKYVMIPVEQAEFDALVQQAGLNAYPQYYAVDNSPLATQSAPQMYVWPPPGGAYPVTARYQRQMPDITTPETSSTIPWFPQQLYLERRLTGEMMLISNDDRAPMFLGGKQDGSGFLGAAAILDKYIKNQGDSQVTKTVTLDRRRFGPAFDTLRSTKTIGW